MANPNIFQSLLRPVKSVADYDADYDMAEGNKLKLAAARMGMEQSQRGAQQAEARRQAFAASGGDRKAYRNALQLIGDFAGVQELDAADLKSRETEADITLKGSQAKKADADIDAKKFEMAKTRIEIMGQSSKYLMDNPTLEGAMQVTQYLMDNGVIDQGMAQKTVAELQANPTPEYIRQRAEQAFRTALGAKEQLEARIAQNRGGTAAVVGVDPVTGKARDLQSAQITQSADNAATQETARLKREQDAKDAAAGRAVQYAGQRLQRDRFEWEKNKPPAAAGAKTNGPMSVTLQKELLESDDTVQSAANVVNTLKSALAINDKAYSGYLAKPRAVLRSNLPGESPEADATIDIDNMMTGQALESLKVVFGGMPTEGERKILLDMQASADKTPTQRKAIMERAIAAAERRAQYAAAKAKSIRNGTYLSGGASTSQDDPPDSSDPLGLRR